MLTGKREPVSTSLSVPEGDAVRHFANHALRAIRGGLPSGSIFSCYTRLDLHTSVFPLFIEALRSVNQVGYLVGGLVLFGLGLLIAGHEIHWRLHATRLIGTIVGVRERGGYYYTVYQYTLPTTGALIEATSSSGSTSIKGRTTGTNLSLLFFPDNPEQAEPAGSWFFIAVGVAFALPGLFLLGIAFRAGAPTSITALVFGIFLVFATFRIRAILVPRAVGGQMSSVATWKKERQDRRKSELLAIPVRPAEQIQVTLRGSVMLVRKPTNPRAAGGFLILLGLILLAAGLWTARRTQHLVSAGVRCSGIVTEVETVSGSDNDTYRAIVEATLPNGETLLFHDKVSTKPALYHVGEQVVVLYLADDPIRSAVIDRGKWKWLVPFLLLVIGGGLLWFGLHVFGSASADRQTPPAPPSGPITRT